MVSAGSIRFLMVFVGFQLVCLISEGFVLVLDGSTIWFRWLVLTLLMVVIDFGWSCLISNGSRWF